MQTTCVRATESLTGGYFAHRRNGEEPCDECNASRRTYEAMKRKRPGYQRRPTWYDRVCEACDSPFRTQNKRTRFCSLDCRHWEAREARLPVLHPDPPPYSNLPALHPVHRPEPRHKPGTFTEGPCAWCSERFTVPHQRPVRYCSRRCSKSAERHRYGRFEVPPSVRLSVYERDGWTCQLCHEPVDPNLPTSDLWSATLDHIVCQSWTLVPDDRPENLRLAHRWCNSVRGDESHYTEDVLTA